MISEEDILDVALSIKKAVSPEEIGWIFQEFANYSKMYPQDTWSEIVEKMIYELKDKK